MTELLLSGGHVVDGSGAEPRLADVLVKDGEIVDVGRPVSDTAAVVDVTGRYVLPGLVDAHSHADGHLGDPGIALALLRQGITTVVAGQDGVAFAPTTSDVAADLDHYFAGVNGDRPASLPRAAGIGALLAHWDEGSYLNAATLVPAGNVRACVIGFGERDATADERRAMRELVETGLAEGAVGLSTGLEYVPGAFASGQELTELTRAVAEAGGVHVSHMRGYEGSAASGLGELFDIAARSGVATHVSHLHGPLDQIAQPLADALARDIDVTFDSYPYRRGNTLLAMLALPSSLQAGTPRQSLATLRDPECRAELVRSWFPTLGDLFARVRIAYVAAPGWTWAEGLALAEIAERLDVPVGEAVCELLLTSDLVVGCVVQQPATNNAEALRTLMRHPRHMAGSDGIFLGSHPHPRGRGAFARFLARHTVELGDWTWGEAARHLSTHAVERFGLGRRGRVEAGHVADLAVIDPATISDAASYDSPLTPAVGVEHVLIGGRFALRGGQLVGDPAGKALRREKVS